MSELDKLDFLLGRWTGKYENQFGVKGVLESSSECVKVLDGRFLKWEGRTLKDGSPLNQAVQFFGYDILRRKYFFKRMWSYGFVENGEGDWEDNDTLVFDHASVDNPPSWFAGSRWKSFIRRYGDSEIGTGLRVSKGGGPFEVYGESRVHRVRS